MKRSLLFLILSSVVCLVAWRTAAQPIASFKVSDSVGCAPLSVTFTADTAGNSIPTTYSWIFGTGSPVPGKSVSIIYASPNSYSVTLTVSNALGTATASRSIQVYGNPIVFYSATPPNGCAPLDVQFTSSVNPYGPTPLTYDWDFGDGAPHDTSGAAVGHTYTIGGGSYNVVLKVTNAAKCFTYASSLNVTPYIIPSPGFTTNPVAVCSAPATVTFSNTSTASSPITGTDWTFGDGSPHGAGATTSYTYTADSNYTVSMKVTDAHGCWATTSRELVVATRPVTFTAPAQGCLEEVITFTNTTPGSSNATWDYGDGAVNSAGSHQYFIPNTYPVQLSVDLGPCHKSLTKSIAIYPLPASTVTFSPPIPCPAPVGVTFTATTPGMTNVAYRWHFSNGDSAIGNPVVDTFRRTGIFYTAVVLAANTVTGCTRLDSIVEVPVRDLIPSLSASSGCFPLTSELSIALVTCLPYVMVPCPPYPEPITTWNYTVWDTNNTTTTFTTPNLTYTWQDSGQYKIAVYGVTANGCRYTDTTSVIATSPVPPSFYATPLVICPRDSITFINTTDTTSTPDHIGYYWRYLPYSGPPPCICIPRYKRDSMIWGGFDLPGKKTVALVSLHYACADTLEKNSYLTVDPTVAGFKYVQTCPPGFGVSFTDYSIEATSVLWDFGDNSPLDTARNPVHIYADTGLFWVRQTTVNDTIGCPDTSRVAVRVNYSYPFMTVDKNPICLGESVHFTGGLFRGRDTMQMAWQFDNDPITPYSDSTDKYYNYTTRGRHPVRLFIKSGGTLTCYDTVNFKDSVLVLQPITGVTGNRFGCAPHVVNFTDLTLAIDTSTIVERDWVYGDGTVYVGQDDSLSHTYKYPGKYSIRVIEHDSHGCLDTLSLTDYIEARHPTALFTTNNTICIRDTVAFVDSSFGATALLHAWNFGDMTTDSSKSPKHSYQSTGSFRVRLIVFDSTQCSDTAYHTINVLGPHAAFTKSDSVGFCKVLQLQFANTSAGTPPMSYSWDMGKGGLPLPIFVPSIYSYSTPGKYIITLTATDSNGCQDMAKDSVYLLGYNGSFSYTPSDICQGDTVQFSAILSRIPQVTWDFGDGHVDITYNHSDTSHIYNTTGTFYPKVIYSDGGTCASADSGLVPIHIDRVSGDFITSIACAGTPFSLTDTSRALFNAPNNWLWIFGNADRAIGKSASYSFPTPGLHPVKLIATNAWGCKDSITKDVFINYLPIVNAGPPDTGICPGDQARLIATGAKSYAWSPSGLVSCVACDTTYVSLAAPTWYYVSGTDTNGCINRDSIEAHIQIKTTASVQPGGEICLGESFRLHVSGATLYKWSPVAYLDSPFIASPLATPVTTTSYVVEAQEGTCLVRYDTVTVVVHPLPYFSAGYEEIINYGGAVVLQPTRAGIQRIEWVPDSTLSCWDCFDPTAHPSYTTTYYATGYSEFGCKSSDSVIVHVRCNGDSVYIPNTFTPNADGLNDYFYPRGKGITQMMSFRIFNRWGELVFERTRFPLNDEKSGWDGTFKGQALPPDVYMYTITTRCISGEPITWKGDVTLVR